MAYNEQLAQQVRKALARQKVEEKRMFGGLGFMVNGKMCVTVNNRPDHVMMVRIDPQVQQNALKRAGAKIAVMRGRKMNGWMFLNDDAITNKKD
ncbi:MAG: TfoX/Sxy family protein, partial [Ignavibacteriales bacterium]|nr:TfoX/Sxy family protein [Ignavibacteriales bacterium]